MFVKEYCSVYSGATELCGATRRAVQFGEVMSIRFWAQSLFEMKPRQTEIGGTTCVRGMMH